MTDSSNPLFQAALDGGGTMPGATPKLPQSFWTQHFDPVFRPHPDNSGRYLAVVQTPLLDLRPEYAPSDPNPTTAFPINRSAALGSGAYFRAAILNEPARHGDTRFFIRHEGHVYRAGVGVAIYRLTEDIEITAAVRAGGYTLAGPDGLEGASVVSAEPPADGLRFWRVVLTMVQTVAAVGGLPRVYPIDAAVM
jgi:hypothetical protein